MNLHLTYKDNNIENFINLDLRSDKYEAQLQQIPRSSCENVIISESINALTYIKAKEILVETVQKLRKGGTISIVSLDFDAISTNYINGNIEAEYLGNILSNINCVIPNHELLNIVKHHGINIVTIQKKDFLIVVHGSRENK